MRPGRNETCSCGSGKKYKRCCGQAPAHGAAPTAPARGATPAPPQLPAGLAPIEVSQFSVLIDRGRWEEAELKARAMLEARPNAGMLWKILSVALARQNKDALPALRRTVELLPSDPEAYTNLSATLRALGRWQEALAVLQQALSLAPDHTETLIRAGDLLSGHGDPGAAVGHYQRALRQNPALLHAHNNLGNALFALARYSEAAAAYRAALEMNPDDAKIHSNLGNTLRNLGSLPEAISSTRRAVAIDPALADAHNNLGLALAAQGEFEQARESYREALARHPHYVDALNNLGNVLRDLGERRESAELYMRAVALDPAHAESHCNLGNVLFESQRTEEAAASYERAIALKDNYPVAHLSYAMALRMLGRTQAAEASCRKSLSLQPDCAEALALLGELRADQGQFAEAQELFECALRADPAFPFAYFNIAMHRKMTAADESWFAAAQSLTARRLPLRHEISLRYALGKYHDDLQDYDAAFDNYFRANELTKRNGLKYDAAQLTRHADEVIELFDAASLRRAQAHGSDAERPVFIVGMPRSGTSLTEQILASHPAVFGAGELSFWDGALSAYKAAAETNADAARELLPRMAEDYEMRLAALSAGAARVIDKMPPNFMNIGLIHAAFPRARIIHMQRHPIDTCLSIYFQYFFNTHPYANDLGSLAHYYREYLRVMEHWRSILAPGALLEVPYESLVSDQELWSRRLLDFVGLPWDAKCLSFHETNRVVLTASKWQVRQKIHTGSRGRWRNYERFVGPLRTLAET